MHHRVGAGQNVRRQLTHVAYVLQVEEDFGQHGAVRQAMAEKTGIVSHEPAAADIATKKSRQNRADVAHIAGDDDPHLQPVWKSFGCAVRSER